jgi:D-alanine-activating enzyme/D-alanine-D-alanyl carrier protein ligase
MQQVLNPKFNQENLPSIKEFLFCGEKLGKPVVNMLFQKFPDARIINTYGPTEATVATTYIDITPEMLLEQEELPVGREVLNAKLSIVNDEICISGIHVMRGYLNNEAKNNECLFINENGERTYRTGDYGFSKDGVFYVLGRKDEQIKFNGYRIELSEIEEKVLNLKALSFKNTAVVALKRNTGVVSRLICFYTANEKKADEEIKTYLSAVLPSYMIPSEFIHIENIPVTTNHKVDKKTLLEQYQNGNFK